MKWLAILLSAVVGCGPSAQERFNVESQVLENLKREADDASEEFVYWGEKAAMLNLNIGVAESTGLVRDDTLGETTQVTASERAAYLAKMIPQRKAAYAERKKWEGIAEERYRKARAQGERVKKARDALSTP